MQPIDYPEGPQSLARDWILKVLAAKGWTPHRLAVEAGLSPATVHRALNDDHVTSNTTLEKISKATGIPTPLAAHAAGQSGFRESDAVPLHAPARTESDAQTWWRLNTRAAELAGYLPGDEVLTDQSVMPRAGDLVCAQVYDFQMGSAETVFRIFDPPYLVVRTMDPSVSTKPLPVDGKHVLIMGTVVRSVRLRSP